MNKLIAQAVFIALAIPSALAQSATSYPYLDDSNGPSKAEPGLQYPRIMLTETQSLKGTDERYSKYDVIGAKLSALNTVAGIQKVNPDVNYHLAFSPRAYQGYVQRDPCERAMGMPFGGTGPATQGCEVFAGHWLYQSGTTTTGAVSATATVLTVQNPSAVVAGDYVVIYDAPAGSFNNAEHAMVQSVNQTSGQVVLKSRGYKSTPRAHGKGAVVARHDLGQGGGTPENWAYNMTTECPKDANNNTVGEAIAEWLVSNHMKNSRGDVVKGVRMDGIYFDADAFFINAGKVDADNDLVTDGAMSSSGVNLWGEGMKDFYRMMRDRFPALILAAGSRRSRGFEDLNGTQMEGWPVSGGYEAVKPSYEGHEGFESVFQRYNVHMRQHDLAPAYVENLSKNPTKTHPRGVSPAPTSNSAFRFGLGSTLLDDGYYGQQNHAADPDPWYDEYAVDVTAGSATYGKAIASDPTNESRIRAHKGWLGEPLDVYERIYDPVAFAPAKTRLANGGFEANTAGWSATNVTLTRTTTAAIEGTSSLHVSKQLRIDKGGDHTAVTGPAVRMEKGKTYTFVFAAKSSEMRDMAVRIANAKGNFLIPAKWTRIVMTVNPTTTGDFKPRFALDKENTEVWIDAVYAFEGSATLMWREFENGAVLVNASGKTQTANLGATWRRILGTGQDPVNDGRTLTSVTLPPWDAAILVRPKTK